MYQVRMYLLTLRKQPSRGRGYFAYRLETVDRAGRLHEKEEFGEEQEITANQLALVAMYRAFEELKKPCEVEVYTDSLYLRGNFVTNLANWTLNSWLNAKGEPVANGGLWRRLEEITQPHVIRFNTAYQWPARARMTDVLQRMKMEGA